MNEFVELPIAATPSTSCRDGLAGSACDSKVSHVHGRPNMTAGWAQAAGLRQAVASAEEETRPRRNEALSFRLSTATTATTVAAAAEACRWYLQSQQASPTAQFTQVARKPAVLRVSFASLFSLRPVEFVSCHTCRQLQDVILSSAGPSVPPFATAAAAAAVAVLYHPPPAGPACRRRWSVLPPASLMS